MPPTRRPAPAPEAAPISDPTRAKTVDGLRFEWVPEHLSCDVVSIHLHHDGCVGVELHFCTSAPGFAPHLLRHHMGDLANASSRNNLARQLRDSYNHVPWDDMMEQICEYTLADLRRVPIVEPMRDFDNVEPPAWILHPFLIRHENNLLFAPGGAGKSYMALYWAILLEAQVADNPMGWIVRESEPLVALYLDWERSRATHSYRFAQLLLGLNLPTVGAPAAFNYWKFHQPLAREIRNAQALINQARANVLICDSAGMAAGGDINGTQPAIEYFGALGALHAADGGPLTTLTLAHTAKNTETGKKSAYGNAYWTNEPSSIWEIAPGGNGLLTLHCNKHNDYGDYPDQSLQVSFHGDDRGTVYAPCEMPTEPLPGEGHEYRILAVLDTPKGRADIAKLTGLNTHLVSVMLGRMADAGSVEHLGRDLWSTKR